MGFGFHSYPGKYESSIKSDDVLTIIILIILYTLVNKEYFNLLNGSSSPIV